MACARPEDGGARAARDQAGAATRRGCGPAWPRAAPAGAAGRSRLDRRDGDGRVACGVRRWLGAHGAASTARGRVPRSAGGGQADDSPPALRRARARTRLRHPPARRRRRPPAAGPQRLLAPRPLPARPPRAARAAAARHAARARVGGDQVGVARRLVGAAAARTHRGTRADARAAAVGRVGRQAGRGGGRGGGGHSGARWQRQAPAAAAARRGWRLPHRRGASRGDPPRAARRAGGRVASRPAARRKRQDWPRAARLVARRGEADALPGDPRASHPGAGRHASPRSLAQHRIPPPPLL
mmetsp:Transcript_22944/g.65639  ORF Transcript_22944/g.65639 Transcript_22944/m.65639 type:complete len:299 (+) Transcript_22944:2152-3048(+)